MINGFLIFDTHLPRLAFKQNHSIVSEMIGETKSFATKMERWRWKGGVTVGLH